MLLKLVLLLCVTQFVHCEKILGVFHMPSRSHHILGSALLKGLAARGHEVTMLSPFSLDSPVKNYEEIKLEYKWSSNDIVQNIAHSQNMTTFNKLSTMLKVTRNLNEMFLNNTGLKDLLKSNRKFDLVILCYFGNDAFLPLSYYSGASTIVFTTVGSNSISNLLTANPSPSSYVPNLMPHFPEQMSFLQRVGNTLTNIASAIFFHLAMRPYEDYLIQKYFPGAPSASELAKNVSLVLLNTHFSIESPRPYVPNMIQVGGFHVEEPKEITGDLKKLMDSSTEGVIFFSLGSNFDSSDLPQHVLDGIIRVLGKLPLKVLWKLKTEISNLPKNVKIENWLPQRDILAHPNLKLFITHGGWLSTTEAVYHGVPMIGIPLFADQEGNTDDSADKGYLVKVSLSEFSEEKFSNAINEVLNNPRYRQNIQRRSKILKDQPLKPLDNAIFWVEYVLRHKGAHHLKVGGLKLEWYQYYLLDVLAFITCIVIVSCTILFYISCKSIKFVKRLIWKKSSKSTLSPKKKPKKSKLA